MGETLSFRSILLYIDKYGCVTMDFCLRVGGAVCEKTLYALLLELMLVPFMGQCMYFPNRTDSLR